MKYEEGIVVEVTSNVDMLHEDRVMYSGRLAVITKVFNGYYHVDIDNGKNFWVDDMFSSVFNLTRSVGEVFNYKGVDLKVVPGNSCHKCFVSNWATDGKSCRSICGPCSACAREDNISVKFIEVKPTYEISTESQVTKIQYPENSKVEHDVKNRTITISNTPTKVFEPKIKTWDELRGIVLSPGNCYITQKESEIKDVFGLMGGEGDKNIFASHKHAKSALAIAQISQLMPYYGGEITDEEWKDENIYKYIICGYGDHVTTCNVNNVHYFLAFHTPEQRDDFLKYNKQLVYDYLQFEYSR